MSKYTTQLNNILITEFDLGMTVSDYPIFDEAYRETLNNKILNHYRWYEIGSETAYRFKYNLNRALNEIMPYYNKLYNAEIEIVNPLLDYKKSITGTKAIATDLLQSINNTSAVDSITTQANNITTVTADKTKQIDSDTPQSELLIGDIENNLFASKVAINENDNTVTEETATNNTVDSDSVSVTSNDTDSDTIETYNLLEEGFNISQAELLKNFRTSFINIDEMIIENVKLRECFLLIY